MGKGDHQDCGKREWEEGTVVGNCGPFPFTVPQSLIPDAAVFFVPVPLSRFPQFLHPNYRVKWTHDFAR